MKLWKRATSLAAAVCASLMMLQAACLADPAAVIAAAHFAEPLVAAAPTSAAEDEALARAVLAHEQRPEPDDVGALTAFLAEHPHSGWAPAVLTNLGLSYLHHGYFSRAIDAWARAWEAGRQADGPRARALVDRAIGERARLYATFGHVESLTALFDEIGARPVTGSATEAVQVAREMLTLMRTDPQELFNCGPVALKILALARGAEPERVAFLQWYDAGPDGTNLAEVGRLADRAKVEHRLVFRAASQPVPLPAIVHWKVGHFAAIVGEANGRFHVEDPVFPGSGLWVTRAALDAEASGYFLVPAGAPMDASWRLVDAAEAGAVWGKGPTTGTDPSDPGCPMCSYNIEESSVSITLADTPVGYVPPIGPAAMMRISYNQREASQPQNFGFFNVSPKWTLNWLGYVTDDPSNPGANVSRYLAGGGAYNYTGYSGATGSFTAQDNDGSILVRTSASTYQRKLRDGSIEVYSKSDGSTGFPRRIFLTQSIDPQGNAATLAYDSQLRLVTLTDATGRQTSFTYGLPGQPLLVTLITDPFGRSARLRYDANGRLSSITDVIGITSSFTYNANSLVDSLTTPYGTTTFAFTAPGTSAPPRFAQATDPLGYSERVEWLEPAPIPGSDNSATVPQGMPVAPVNQYLEYRNSFHWDKNAYVAAGCTPTGGCDYTKARISHFSHVPNTTLKSSSIESVKFPLQNRIWFNYPGQSSSLNEGTFSQPTAIGRVLDDGATQLTQFSYDATGFYNLTKVVDPLGRATQFIYAANGVDLIEIAQTTAIGTRTAIAQFTFNDRHRPIIYTDESGATSSYEYNAAGQIAATTNALGETTSYQYDSFANLTAIINANSVTAAGYTYDAYARVRTYTDSEGWMVTNDYDAADRVTKATYPDGTTDSYAYDRLDLVSVKDRQGRVWAYTFDANRRLTAITDPLGQQVVLGYNRINQVTSLTDPKSNTTSWTYDLEGRLTAKQFADASTVAYGYETTTNRLKSVTDALGQVKQYAYAKDDLLTAISYLNAVNPTPNVTFAYDAWFPRPVSMTDGTGTTQYSYAAPFSSGALQLVQECFTPTGAGSCSHQIGYAYDVLARPSSRTVTGAGAETFAYDALGRLTAHTNDLGAFALGYLGQTGQIASRQLASSTLATAWSYLPNSGDRRLSGIANTGLSAGQFSNFQFTTTPENLIAAIAETSDAAAVYPVAGTQTASHNNLNELTSLSGQALTWDANGNVLTDGQRAYSWDAETRLVGITYPGQSGKQTEFTYDGQGRRTRIASTPAGGGGTVTTSYVWCGDGLCQARNATNALTRAYYDEGEFVPGAPAQPYYYGPDQLGSARRVFASTSSAPAYGYDPYGNALQATAPVTDFNYAGLFYNAESGLYLTQYRAYDPVAGRWLSRDPLGEGSDAAANLYPYAAGNPVSYNDPTGENPLIGAIIGGAIGGAIGNAIGQAVRNGGKWWCIDPWEVAAGAVAGAGIGAGMGPLFGGVGGRLLGPLLSGTRSGLAASRLLGRAGEIAAGIVKNTERIPSATGTAAYRVPDMLNHATRTVGEVKNVGSLSNSNQIRDIASYAQSRRYTFELTVRSGKGTQLSGPLKEAIRNGGIVLRNLQ